MHPDYEGPEVDVAGEPIIDTAPKGERLHRLPAEHPGLQYILGM